MSIALKSSHRSISGNNRNQAIHFKPQPDRQEEEKKEKVRTKGRGRARISILVVCDDLSALKQMEKTIRRMKFCPVGVVNPDAALNRIRMPLGKSGYDLMVVNLSEPSAVSGILKEARALEPDLRVIVICNGGEGSGEALRDAGARMVFTSIPDNETFYSGIIDQLR